MQKEPHCCKQKHDNKKGERLGGPSGANSLLLGVGQEPGLETMMYIVARKNNDALSQKSWM